MDNQKTEMSFLEHLEVLRWHLIRSALAIVIFASVAAFYPTFLFKEVLLAPTSSDFISYRVFSSISEFIGFGGLSFDHLDSLDLQYLAFTGAFLSYIKISVYAGFILAFPYVIWEMFKFIKPALHVNEKKSSLRIIFFGSLLFLLGILFGYYFVTPISMSFLIAFSKEIGDGIWQENFTTANAISTVTTICFANAIIFELPIVVYFLSKARLITPKFLRKYKRHAMVLTLILSAIITPPDIVTQILVAVPILALYEISIKISENVYKKTKE